MDLQDIRLLRSGIKHLIDVDAQHGLRDKQVEAFRALVSGKFTDQQIAHSYFKLPTGFGKTVMFATMARAYFDAVKSAGAKRQKIIIIVPRLSLINQTKEKLDKFADLVATEFSGRVKDNKSDIVITTYNSLSTLFGTVNYDSVGLIFADEAHHMLGEMISDKLTKFNKHVPIIGFTATPEYETNRAVADMLTTEIFAMDIPDSIKSGILSPVKNVLYRSSIVCNLEKVPSSTNGDIDYKKMKISPDTLATEIARIYAEGVDEDTGIEFRNLKAIVNCPNAEIANLQAAKINEIMGREVAISLHKVGISNKKYDCLQQDFIDGKYTIACQVGTMTEGFDDVTVSMCINYPTRSRVKAEQAAGRAIRLDDNNPNKIAFVVDTIFRNTPEASNEDILYTVSNSKQVLFKDIAGGMILFPRDFRGGHKGGQGRNKPEFADFDLITDSTTLIELNRNAEGRIANETIEEKTEEWLSARELAADPSFPMGNADKIREKMEELQAVMPDFIKTLKNKAWKFSLYLHRDARDVFLEKIGFIEYPPKTEEWLSSADLEKDENFPMKNLKTINKKLEEFKDVMPRFIQMRRPRFGRTCWCLHKDAKEMFLKKIGFIDYPQKTEEWLSNVDLARDESFPIRSDTVIKEKLEEFKGVMPRFVQMRKSKSGVDCLCLHKDAKEIFLEKIGFMDYPQKTEEWLSGADLEKDESFPMKNRITINKKLEKIKDIMPKFIQIRKTRFGGVTCLCLHKDAKEMFLEKIGFMDYPLKTEEWLSNTDLARDKSFPINTPETILHKLEELRFDMLKYIQMRKSKTGKSSLCLHKDAKEMFLRKTGFMDYPMKTEEWLSNLDLLQDKKFPIKSPATVKKKLEELQPEMYKYIQMVRNSQGRPCLCLHRDGREEFLRRVQESKTKSMKKATTGIVAVNNAVEISKTVKSTTEPDIHQK